MIEKVACDVASCFGWCLLQITLENQLTILISQLQIDVLSGTELEVLVELHQIEMILGLSRLNVDLRQCILDHLDDLWKVLLIRVVVRSSLQDTF